MIYRSTPNHRGNESCELICLYREKLIGKHVNLLKNAENCALRYECLIFVNEKQLYPAKRLFLSIFQCTCMERCHAAVCHGSILRY